MEMELIRTEKISHHAESNTRYRKNDKLPIPL